MEDLIKVKAKVDELNRKDSTSRFWISIPGYFSMLKTTLNDDGSAAFFANEGLPVKTFLNTETGEIRIFPAKSFEKKP